MIVVTLLFLGCSSWRPSTSWDLQRAGRAARERAQGWSNLDVLLTQRHDELPKLVEACKRYMAYEQTLER